MFTQVADRLLPRTAGQAFAWSFGLTLVGGLVVLLILIPLTGRGVGFGGRNHDGYWELAGNLVRGEGYVFEPGGAPVIHRAPLFPCLLAPLTFLPVNLQRPGIILLQSLMMGATCWLLFDLAFRALGRRIAGYTVVLLLLYPWLYLHVTKPALRLFQTLLLCLVLDLICRELLRAFGPARSTLRRLPLAVLLGLAMAGAILTHGTMILSIPLILLLMTGVGIALRNERPMRFAVLASAVTVACIAPWTWRNWRVTGRFIPVVSNSGYAYFWSNAHWCPPGARASGLERERALLLAGVHREPSELIHFSGLKDPKVDHLINRRMVEHIRASPARFAEKTLLNAAEFYFPVVHDAWELIKFKQCAGPFQVARKLPISGWHAALWLLALVGLRRQRRPTTRLRLLLALACIALLAIPYFPFLVGIWYGEYALHTMPLLCLLAASGLVTLLPGREEAERELGVSRLPSREGIVFRRSVVRFLLA